MYFLVNQKIFRSIGKCLGSCDLSFYHCFYFNPILFNVWYTDKNLGKF